MTLDENIFELRVVSTKLEPAYFDGLPSTFVSFDFFQHDTQAVTRRYMPGSRTVTRRWTP